MKILIIYKKEELKEAEDMQKNFNKFSKLAGKGNKWIFEIQEEKENVQ